MNIAVIGYGYWGPNLVRNFSWIQGVNVRYVCDLDENRLAKVAQQFTNVEKTTTDIEEVVADDSVEAVIISTPVHSHYVLAKKALLAGKHVLVEKPMTNNSRDAKELIQIADEKNLILMVDHTFLYTGAVRKMKELIDADQIGKINYFDSVRINLGLFQHDVNVVWDLAPHDFSIMQYLIDQDPISVSATGVSHVTSKMENIAYISVFYPDNIIGHFHVNWLSPVKIRRILLCGSEKMIMYDDMENMAKIKLFDTGVEVKQNDQDAMYETLIQYRTGDMHAPQLDGTEALKLECLHFLDCIKEKKQPISNGVFGLKIVRLLEAAQESIQQKGKIIEL